jgi:hypothetical protein
MGLKVTVSQPENKTARLLCITLKLSIILPVNKRLTIIWSKVVEKLMDLDWLFNPITV